MDSFLPIFPVMTRFQWRISRSNARAKEAVVTDCGAGCVGRAHSPAVNADILSDRPWRRAAPGCGYGVGWFKRPLLQLHGISSGPSAELFRKHTEQAIYSTNLCNDALCLFLNTHQVHLKTIFCNRGTKFGAEMFPVIQRQKKGRIECTCL